MNPNDSVNPYEPPRSYGPAADVAPQPRLGIYRPRIAPRDALDVMLGLFLGVPGAISIYLIPVGLVVILGAPLILAPIAVLTVLVMAVMVVFSGIQKVVVTAEGLVIHRAILPRIEFRWSDITEIRDAGRMEAYRAMFFVPHRTCAQTLTCKGHFRIETPVGYVIFPPKEIDEFRATIHSLWSQAISGGPVET